MTPLFVKLMMMTTSSQDAEALTAIRKANAILAAANVNWEEFLTAITDSQINQSPTPAADDDDDDDDGFEDIGKHNGKYDDADEINRLFSRAFARTSHGSGFRDFLDSVHEWWEKKGFLTEKQYHAIRRAATR